MLLQRETKIFYEQSQLNTIGEVISSNIELTDRLLIKLVELEGNIPCSCDKRACANY